jgi:hypothetical protein
VKGRCPGPLDEGRNRPARYRAKRARYRDLCGERQAKSRIVADGFRWRSQIDNAPIPSRKRSGAEPPSSHHFPLFGIETQGSLGGNGEPFCKISIECLSGERTKAMLPSRGGRLMLTPAFISFSQRA